jgi:hypothetical protein
MKNKPIILLCFLASLELAKASISGQVTVYRYSGDFTHHVIYLGTNVAISKINQTDGLGETKTHFGIGRAKWQGQPELASTTGDVFETTLQVEPRRMGLSDDGRWLLVEGRAFNESAGASQDRIILVSLASGKSWSDKNPEALQNQLNRAVTLKLIRTEPAPVFFDRMVVGFLKSKSRH